MVNKPNETILVDKKKDYFILTKESVQERIYVIRGEKVMLDFELAEIYGYDTRNFNKQVKNNSDRFPDLFMFQITKDEWDQILRWKKIHIKLGREKKTAFCFYGTRYLHAYDCSKRTFSN